MKVALVHDYLIDFGGAERVLMALHNIWPEADVYVSIYNAEGLGETQKIFKDWKIKTSWFNKIPLSKRLISPLRFLLPLVWRSFDFSEYDLVVSSSAWAMSKGIKTKGKTKHVCYCHTPPRFLYHYPEARRYTHYLPVRIYAAIVNHLLRFYDYLTSQKVDLFIANSNQVAGRIRKFYRRESVVVNPPIDLPEKISASNEDYYLFISRLVSYKHPDLAAEACGQLGLKLVIAGDGPLRQEVEGLAKKYKNVNYLGRVSDSKLKELYENCKCLIYPVESEDFGMVPLEAAGFGKPVIAFYSGGAKETVVEGVSGLFCEDFSLESLKNKITEFEEKKYKFDPQKIRFQAEKRSYSNFSRNILKAIKSLAND